ncbi:hypothetical protein CCACVL1_17029 [Corchorus capsularis]|uniref:Uncharacterized protein n=1 Tax=Corchorus capsularis TaxID=210143 RepID=A0A1R3HUD6_COCAP|nr:hypothetical protein CCACVL1_17029 [Corchorus capsularis]
MEIYASEGYTQRIKSLLSVNMAIGRL